MIVAGDESVAFRRGAGHALIPPKISFLPRNKEIRPSVRFSALLQVHDERLANLETRPHGHPRQ